MLRLGAGLAVTAILAGCAPIAAPALADACPLRDFAAASKQVSFEGADGTPLAGQLDLPAGAPQFPTVVILHHSGPVDRCAYDYMAQLLVGHGFAVFRFDKRGTGHSAGTYGCCEADDAVEAWRAAAALPEVDRDHIYLMAQSLGTQIAADRSADLAAAQQPSGVLLLSSLLDGSELARLPGPILLVLSASEPDLAEIGPQAAQRYKLEGGDIQLFIAEGTEHTLFDTTAGPVDWGDPAWRDLFHAGAAEAIVGWLQGQAGRSESMRGAAWTV